MDQDQAAAISLVHQNSVPSVQMQCRITAILRAIATRAFFDPMRLASRVPQALSGDQRCTFVRRTLAASYRHVRVNRSPQFEMWPCRSASRTDIVEVSARGRVLHRGPV